MKDDDSKKDDEIDENLWVQTGGKLYVKKEKPEKLILEGVWNFQFSEDEKEFIEIIVNYIDTGGIAAAAGIPSCCFGRLNKNSVHELHHYLGKVLQRMNQVKT
jgi:hypothetical protein